MIYLLDTHILLWASTASDKLPARVREILADPTTGVMFSAAVIWEISIKFGLGRDDFAVNPRLFRRALLEHGYTELPIDSRHTAEVADLPNLHRDPFDRIQITQSRVEGIVLLTADSQVAQYGGLVEAVPA